MEGQQTPEDPRLCKGTDLSAPEEVSSPPWPLPPPGQTEGPGLGEEESLKKAIAPRRADVREFWWHVIK